MQDTIQLCREYSFEGKGLHTGCYSHVTVCPAPENTGIRFIRTDIGEDAWVDALAENVSSTKRSTTISQGETSVRTIEHILSALTGLGIDNAIVRIDAVEMPILDGSARMYVEQMGKDPLVEQKAERKWIELKAPIEVRNEKKGAYVKLIPSDSPKYSVTIDFDSRVLGMQGANGVIEITTRSHMEAEKRAAAEKQQQQSMWQTQVVFPLNGTTALYAHGVRARATAKRKVHTK